MNEFQTERCSSVGLMDEMKIIVCHDNSFTQSFVGISKKNMSVMTFYCSYAIGYIIILFVTLIDMGLSMERVNNSKFCPTSNQFFELTQ